MSESKKKPLKYSKNEWKPFSLLLMTFPFIEAATRDVLKNFAKFTGKHLYRSLFFNKALCNFIKQETLGQMFFSEFCETFKKTPPENLFNTSRRLLLHLSEVPHIRRFD